MRQESNLEMDRDRLGMADAQEGVRVEFAEVFVGDCFVLEDLYQRVGQEVQRLADYRWFEGVCDYSTGKSMDICS